MSRQGAGVALAGPSPLPRISSGDRWTLSRLRDASNLAAPPGAVGAVVTSSNGTRPQARITVVPLTLPRANRIIEGWHRHHGPLPGGFAWWAVAAVTEEGRIVGVALAGRPTNRNNDDGQTVEVQRVATDGEPNACSALYGACARAARAIGAARIITYTLESESGASLRAAGWIREADGITSWWTHAGSRTPAVNREHMTVRKVRWARHFRDVIPVEDLSLAPLEGAML
jgi:hypothetical protein